MSKLKSSFEAALERVGISIAEKIIPSAFEASLRRINQKIEFTTRVKIDKAFRHLSWKFSGSEDEGGNPRLMNILGRLHSHQYGQDYFRSTRLSRTGIGGVKLQEARSGGLLHAYGDIGLSQHSISPMTRYMQLKQRMQNYRIGWQNGDYRPSLSIGGDDQFAFGADTGVHDDFEYLREEEREQNDRRLKRSLRKHRGYRNYIYDTMSDYDRSMHDLRMRYGGDRGLADASLRNTLKKELGPFFKNSRMSTKNLYKLSSALNSVRDVPLIGDIAELVKNPIGRAVALWGLAGVVANNAMSSNRNNVALSNLRNVFGKPSGKFARSAAMAGMNTEAAISAWGALQNASYGNGEMYLSLLASTKGQPEWMRNLFASSLGVSPEMINVADEMYGGGAGDRKSREINRKISAIEAIEKYGYAPDASLGIAFDKFMMDLPLIGGLAKYLSGRFLDDSTYTDSEIEWLTNKVGYNPFIETQEAARSLDNYQHSGADYTISTPNAISDGGNVINMRVDNVNVKSDNVPEFKRGMIEQTKYATNRAIAENADRKVVR